jgi:hypothetical protein
MNTTKTISRFKRWLSKFTDRGPRIHLRSPFAVRPSRAQCKAMFYRALSASIDRIDEMNALTNQQLAAELWVVSDAFPVFCRKQDIIEEAASRLDPDNLHALSDDMPIPIEGEQDE